jgi:transketolase
MRLNVVWIFSHDSVAVGEDGPTHQPIEHLATVRAIPGLTVIRPADANETAEAWRLIVAGIDGPAMLVLTRQNLPILDRGVFAPASGLQRGAYVLADVETPDVVLIATGSEVSTTIDASALLADQGVRARIVSMPSWELFEAQDAAYRAEVLPAGVPKISVEAASTFGWCRWADASIGIDRFGASGPGAQVLSFFGISPEGVASQVQTLLTELGKG